MPGDREPHRSITVLVAHTHPAAVTIAAPVARPTLFAAVVPAVEVLFLQIVVHARTAMLDTLRSVQSNLARPNLYPNSPEIKRYPSYPHFASLEFNNVRPDCGVGIIQF